MTARFAASVLTAALLAAAPGAQAASGRAAELERRLHAPDGAVSVVAHRGCWEGTSENTLDAISACIAFGVDMVELDVRRTADGALVLMHDSGVDRMTDGKGEVSALTLAQVRALKVRAAKGGPTAALTERRVPTLDEALDLAKDRVLINIDAKDEVLGEVQQKVRARGMQRQVLFKSGDPAAEVLAASWWVPGTAYHPNLKPDQLGADPAATIAAYDGVAPVGFEINVKSVADARKVSAILAPRCVRFWANSLNTAQARFDDQALVDPDAAWGALIGAGVNAIQTDHPLALKAYLALRRPKAQSCERP